MNSLFIRVVTLVLMLLPVLAFADFQLGQVEVGRFVGKVIIVDGDGQGKHVVSGLKLTADGMTIETGSNAYCEIIFSNGSRIVLTPDTLVTVNEFTQVESPAVPSAFSKISGESVPSITELSLSHGKIIGQAQKLRTESVYLVLTPASSVRIHDASIGKARDSIYVVEYRPGGKKLDKTIAGCLRGFVETSINSSNVGFVTVDPVMQVESHTPPVAPDDSANSNAPPTAPNSKITSKSLADSVKITAYPIPAEECLEIISILEKYSTFPAEIIAALRTITRDAPTRSEIFSGTSPGVPNKRYGRLVSGDAGSDSVAKPNGNIPPPPPVISNAPYPPMKTTTGGSEVVDPELKRIIDNVNEAIQAPSEQLNPTPVGG